MSEPKIKPLSPQTIHCLALNYAGIGEHNQTPLYFIKSPSALCFNGAIVEAPRDVDRFWTEVELTIVISKTCSMISPEEAEDYIEGYIVGADITCANIHSRDHHLAFSKSRKNFCPVSYPIATVKLSSRIELTTEINGKITQRGSLAEMRYNAYESLALISKIIPLQKGDIVLTGTPKGVENNRLKPGDKVCQYIDAIGILEYEIG